MSTSSVPLPFGSAPSKLDVTGKRMRPAGNSEDGDPNKKAKVSPRETHNQFSKGTRFDMATQPTTRELYCEDMPPFWHETYKRKPPEAEESPRKKVKLLEGLAHQRDNIGPRNRIRQAGPPVQPSRHTRDREASSQVHQNAQPASYQQVLTQRNEGKRPSLPHPTQPSFKRPAPSHAELLAQRAQHMGQTARGSERVSQKRVASGRARDGGASLGGRIPDERVLRGGVAERRGPGSTTRQPELLRGVLHQQNNLQRTLLAQNLDPKTLKPRLLKPYLSRGVELAKSSYIPGNQGPRGHQDRGFQTSEVPRDVDTLGNRQIRGSQDNVIRGVNLARISDQQRLQDRHSRTLGAEFPRNSNALGMRVTAGPQDSGHQARVVNNSRVSRDQGVRSSHDEGLRIQGLNGPETLNVPSSRRSTVLQKGSSHALSAQQPKRMNALKRAAPGSDNHSAPIVKKARNAGLEGERNEDDFIHSVNDLVDPSTFDTDFLTGNPIFAHPTIQGNADSSRISLPALPATNGAFSQGQPLGEVSASINEQPFDMDASIQDLLDSQSSFPVFDAWLANGNGNESQSTGNNEVKERKVDSKDPLRDFDGLIAEGNRVVVISTGPQMLGQLVTDFEKFPSNNAAQIVQEAKDAAHDTEHDEPAQHWIESQKPFDFKVWLAKNLAESMSE